MSLRSSFGSPGPATGLGKDLRDFNSARGVVGPWENLLLSHEEMGFFPLTHERKPVIQTSSSVVRTLCLDSTHQHQHLLWDLPDWSLLSH